MGASTRDFEATSTFSTLVKSTVMQCDVVLSFTVRTMSRLSSIEGTPCCIDSRVAMGEPPTGWPRPATVEA